MNTNWHYKQCDGVKLTSKSLYIFLSLTECGVCWHEISVKSHIKLCVVQFVGQAKKNKLKDSDISL